MILFSVEGKISDKDKDHIRQYCQENFSSDILINTERSDLKFEFSISEISSLASVTIALISLFISIKKNKRESFKKEEWGIDSVRRKVRDELLKFGVEDFQLQTFEGLENFIKNKKNAEVKVKANTSRESFIITLSKEGNVNVIQID